MIIDDPHHLYESCVLMTLLPGLSAGSLPNPNGFGSLLQFFVQLCHICCSVSCPRYCSTLCRHLWARRARAQRAMNIFAACTGDQALLHSVWEAIPGMDRMVIDFAACTGTCGACTSSAEPQRLFERARRLHRSPLGSSYPPLLFEPRRSRRGREPELLWRRRLSDEDGRGCGRVKES